MALDYNDVVTFMKRFEVDILNRFDELIIDEPTNTYVSIKNCKNIEDIELYVTYALCRPIGKGLDDHDAKRLMRRFNKYFNTNLNQTNFLSMYTELCYARKLDEFRDFIKRGFPVRELKTEEDYR